MTGSVVDAVKRDLAEIGRVDKELAKSALAASALAMAAEMDDVSISATAKANCARVLLDSLDRLRALMPPAEERDGIDELGARRAGRRAVS